MNIKFLEDEDAGENIKSQKKIEDLIKKFVGFFSPIEQEILVIKDSRTNAFYIEVHLSTDKIIKLSTLDVPIDPDEQSEYRGNREPIEDHYAFLQMKEDAKKGRTFSNLVAEFSEKYEKEKPLKIIGGQHRFLAIKEAYEQVSINKIHGFKIYFDLNIDQRLDVQLISNTNIAVATDLLDRMYETIKGPELRDWCQNVGLLTEGEDFSDKKERTSKITVRLARSFIMSYIEGKNSKGDFEKINPTPLISKTGTIDEGWEKIRETKSIWTDKKMINAAKKYVELHLKQIKFYKDKDKPNHEYAYKAFTYSIISSWAYVAGFLEDNQTRLNRHFTIDSIGENDYLNSNAMSKGKHKTDPENYRGLGTRNDKKELGRLCELFYLQAERGNGINQNLVDLAIKKYHAKIAALDVIEAEKKVE